MNLLPNEILEHIGSYLPISDLFQLRLSTWWLLGSLTRLYRIRTNHTRWKITAHLVFDKHHQDFEIHRSWVSIGNFRGSFDVMHRHEDCTDCYNQYLVPNEIDHMDIPDEYITYHGNTYLQSQQICTVVRKGVGGHVLQQIINNIHKSGVNITIGWNPSLLNVVNNNIFILLGNQIISDSLISQTKSCRAELCLGSPRCIRAILTDDITYGLMGPLCRDENDSPYDWDEDF